ncbi:hypothetical protein [Streptomyces sp. NPDC055056]
MPSEKRELIDRRIEAGQEGSERLRGVQGSGTTAEVARALLERLAVSTNLIEDALVSSALAAVAAGVAVRDVAAWSGLSAQYLADITAADTG